MSVGMDSGIETSERVTRMAVTLLSAVELTAEQAERIDRAKRLRDTPILRPRKPCRKCGSVDRYASRHCRNCKRGYCACGHSKAVHLDGECFHQQAGRLDCNCTSYGVPR